MLKLVILLGVAVVLVMWFTKGRLQGKRPPAPGADGGGQTPNAGPTTMVSCAHCGVHLPQTDALTDSAGRHFCGEPHRLAGKR
jgi:uncharacterized protein